MSWTTITWSAAGGVCLALAVVHALVWSKSRESWANLAFAVAALMAAITTQFELGMMHAETPAEYGRQFWLLHTPVNVLIIALAWFVYLYLEAGRLWLLWLLVTSRAVLLVANLLVRPNLNFHEISGLRQLQVWGETLVLPIGTPRPWTYALGGTALLLVIFVIDASITAWRRGQRRRGAIVGGTVALAVVLSVILSQMHNYGLLSMPYTLSPLFLIVVLGMAYELGLDLVRARQTSRELEQSQQRVRLASRAANLVLWDWDIVRNDIRVSEVARPRAGVGESERITLERYLELLHPDDRAPTREAARSAVEGAGDFAAEFRRIGDDGRAAWVSVRGQVERGSDGKPLHLRGISMDITARKQAEEELQKQRAELAHVQRVSSLGQLSSALAHEINQPLAAILRNAEAGELLLRKDPPDLEEVRAILGDIRSDEQRAASVIERMRSLLKRRALQFEPLDMAELVRQVVALLHAESQARQVALHLEMPRELPEVSGDRVHLQQVVLNLLFNSIDASERQPDERRRVVIRASRTAQGLVELAVTDRGEGIAPDLLPRLFEPFLTTKSRGIGIGLAISRTIVELHGGQISAENNPQGGATFRFTLKPAAPEGGA